MSTDIHWLDKFIVLSFDSIDSTNAEAHRLIGSNSIHEDFIVISKIQTLGKTSKPDKTWKSPTGNLYCTLAFKEKTLIQNLIHFSFIASLSMQQAVIKLCTNETDKTHIKLKWPNDILIDNKKLSGILLESIPDINYNEGFWLIVGVGVNVSATPVIPDAADRKRQPISLLDIGCKVSSSDLLDAFVNCFEHNRDLWRVHGFNQIKKLWEKSAWRINEKLSYRLNNETISGVFNSIDGKSGALILRKDDGSTCKISSGECFTLEN